MSINNFDSFFCNCCDLQIKKIQTTNFQIGPAHGAIRQVAPEVVFCGLAEHQRELSAAVLVAYYALVVGDLEKIEQLYQALVVFVLLSQMQAVRVLLLFEFYCCVTHCCRELSNQIETLYLYFKC